MDHVKILGIKFITISITVLSLFGIFNDVGLGNLALISLLTTIISYLIGDMFILRRFGNVAASIADFGLAFVSYWLLGSLFIVGGGPLLLTALAAAFFTACAEAIIHIYILDVFTNFRGKEDSEDYGAMGKLQTEFAEEMDVDKHSGKDDPLRKQKRDR
ncbi:YndM family protein [Virgibacillus alimentarius]|uniref:Membrane protein implicated in regulation of membrane protease activity n=1 Tax=Virgibacillus alimentarius TaxID=698769 RepID=A0ABS4SAX2_9BACI|nr:MULTISPECIES: YndM family protein [Virgibacillus]MBP2258648.1 membrane protein implicated in regulation of membrane protease activity [Virgibacillus alimentarius]HLR66602.1 YndM family protein [Virgibacillus sp.]